MFCKFFPLIIQNWSSSPTEWKLTGNWFCQIMNNRCFKSHIGFVNFLSLFSFILLFHLSNSLLIAFYFSCYRSFTRFLLKMCVYLLMNHYTEEKKISKYFDWYFEDKRTEKNMKKKIFKTVSTQHVLLPSTVIVK